MSQNETTTNIQKGIDANVYQAFALITESVPSQATMKAFSQLEPFIQSKLASILSTMYEHDYDRVKREIFYKQHSQDLAECEPLPQEAMKNPDIRKVRFVHGLLGLFSELVELLEACEDIDWNFDLDDDQLIHFAEELGDLGWYINLMVSALGVNFGTVLQANVAKLAVRYKEKFESVTALNRNLEAEYETLKNYFEPNA